MYSLMILNLPFNKSFFFFLRLLYIQLIARILEYFVLPTEWHKQKSA